MFTYIRNLFRKWFCKQKATPANVGVPLYIPCRHRIFTVNGMQRAGNHAVINWLAKHFDSCQFNNNIMNGKPSKTEERGDPPFETIINSYENRDPYCLFSDNPFDVLILRDPYNWLASLLHCSLGLATDLDEKVSMYLRHCEWAESHMLNWINYNSWFRSPKYRRSIETLFLIPSTDNGLLEVPNYGEGSSFDKRIYHMRANQMTVLNRWEYYKNNEVYLDVFSRYSELTEYSKEFFGFCPKVVI